MHKTYGHILGIFDSPTPSWTFLQLIFYNGYLAKLSMWFKYDPYQHRNNSKNNN